MEKDEFTIVVIDDNPADIESLRRILGEIKGWKILLLGCTDAKAGCAEALRRQIDLILLDNLAGLENGLEVFQEIREGGCIVPVIMLTSHGNEEVAVEAIKAGVSDYLIKGRINSDSLRLVISTAVQKFELQQKMEEQRKALLDAERQRVMMESVGAACHHFAGPLTTVLSSMQILAETEGIEEAEKRNMLQQCLEAAKRMKMILNKFQQVREYRTRPFLDDYKIIDIGLGSIHGTTGISKA